MANIYDPPATMSDLVSIQRGVVEGWPVFAVSPPGETPRGRLLYLHGGGHVTDLTPVHWAFIARLVVASGWEAVVPVFPVVPHATHRDIYPVLRRLYEDEIAPQGATAAIVGDSSGGTLALALLETLPKRERPPRTVLLSPWLDAVLDNPDIAMIEPFDVMSSRARLRRFAQLFSGGDGLAIPAISPLRGPLDQLGQITVFAGTRDILSPDTRVLARTAGPGTVVDLREYPDQGHVWMLLSEVEGATIANEVASILAGDVMPT